MKVYEVWMPYTNEKGQGYVDPHTDGITGGKIFIALPDGVEFGVTHKESRMKEIKMDREISTQDVDIFIYKED